MEAADADAAAALADEAELEALDAAFDACVDAVDALAAAAVADVPAAPSDAAAAVSEDAAADSEALAADADAAAFVACVVAAVSCEVIPVSAQFFVTTSCADEGSARPVMRNPPAARFEPRVLLLRVCVVVVPTTDAPAPTSWTPDAAASCARKSVKSSAMRACSTLVPAL